MGAAAKQSYREFLQSDRWKALRLHVLAHCKATCRICLKEDVSNDVHHVVYPAKWRHTKPHHLVVLCRECHGDVHRIMGDEIFDKPAGYFKRYKEVESQLRSVNPRYAEKMASEPNFRMKMHAPPMVDPGPSHKDLKRGAAQRLQRLRRVLKFISKTANAEFLTDRDIDMIAEIGVRIRKPEELARRDANRKANEDLQRIKDGGRIAIST